MAASADVSIIKRNALRYSLAAIASVFVFEFTAGIITNSLAVLTDSTHALLDAVVTAILIIAVSLAAKPRDKEHTYGHGRIETIGGFIGGAALFVVSIFFIYEAAARLAFGGTAALSVNPGMIGFAAVVYTLAVDAFRMAVLGRAMRKTRSGAATLKADLYHAIADFASTAVALVGLWLVTTGFYQGDAIAAVILGAFLAYLSSKFAYQNAFELTDSIPPRLVARVRQAAAETDGVLDCKDVKMRRVGNDIFAEVTISLKADISFEKAHEISAQVERNIESSLAQAGDSVESITVHFEPIYGPDLPLESIIERAAARVSGVKGVHNIIVSRVVDGTDRLEISLHIQVNRSASLSEAHAIASAVEESIKGQVKRAENVTVHLEPLMPEVAGVQPLADIEIQNSIRQIVLASGDIKKVGRIATFRTDEDTLKIDVDIGFSTERPSTIEQVHELVTEIEKQIRAKYPGSIVTIHAEPG
ncbi:cation diffusion facilitator family transporter [Candidatus Nitrososphaera evergladensis SR1]|uniref:Cation diffusion facilitator family transporter n=1 Tax=Candidatus Nitrososphaera evergladensis SR1 TaxID=1459636 RepID=A0A075MSX3_9ARCH|nr:cation diffusion facilitator family transporter [Candidatus Nitrososphaera evergladensis]AIF84681.1 cation diffusion facilitator family transporter [Candidatus Nitrososphaera evergladensis SR1]